ncbi:MAG: NYN domain-containing protein [Patescibacteria group bacterium]
MPPEKANFAFIDEQNVYAELKKCGWKIDYFKFRIYLKEKYNVERAYIFIGRMKEHEDLYELFNQQGFECIFKKVTIFNNKIKGNCDSDLVLHSLRLIPFYHQAVILSGDGDFTPLIEYLLFHDKLRQLIVPNRHKYSSLLKPFRDHTAYMNDFESRLKRKPLEEQNP